MTAAPAIMAARAGHGQLVVENVQGQSAATVVEGRSPLKLLVPRPRGQSVWAYLSNFGGGLLPGDTIDVSLDVAASARCFLGTQSSTKIFRGGDKGVVTNRLRARVGAGGLLVYAPDVAQGFAQSRFAQEQRFELCDATSALVFLDWYSSGRQARGERWAFSEYSSRTEITVAEKRIYFDSVCLEADSLAERMGRVNCVASLAVIGLNTESLLAEVAAAPISKRMDLLVVGSPIRGGALLRFAGVSVEIVARAIFSRLKFISDLLGDNPFERKW
jgi:urease accessory protein